jgi:AcrR family transcriptional regulator
MSKGSMDRRVARTRTSLHHALVSLILTRDYEAITIQEICKAAKVGRSTFYDHYTSKDDLHRCSVENLRSAVTGRPDSKSHNLSFSLPLFEHVYEYKDLLGALSGGRGGAVALASIRRTVSELVRDELARSASPDWLHAVPRELVVEHVVGAYMSVLAWWLDSGAKLPPHAIDAIVRHMLMRGIASSSDL